MTTDTGTRRLQTVMFTDIKGFSAMMSADEQATVELVLEHRDTVRARLAEHGGVEHETIGDAFLTLFDSPVNAATCAIAIQEDFATRNAARPANRQVWLRIGLHLGDIIHRDGGIYGDGVNLASRIEGCAEAGGVCLSEQVRLQIQGRVPVTTELMPDVDLKGIAHPPPVYRMVLTTERGLTGTERATKSLRYGKQLVMATAALVCLVAAALAVNGSQSKAKDRTSDANAPTLKAPTAATRAAPTAATRAAPSGQAPRVATAAELAAGRAAAEATARAEAAEIQARITQKRVEAMSETMHKAAKAKVAAAMNATGAARVTLLKDALSLDPDNAALAQLLMHTQADVARSRAHSAKSQARPARRRPVGVTSKPTPTATGPATIQPRVVED